jgi:uncharacterized membrane protein YgcG
MPATPAMDSGGGPATSAPNISIIGRVQQALNENLLRISGQIQQQPYVPQQQRSQLQQATNQLQASNNRLVNPTPAERADQESMILRRDSINQYHDPYFRNSASDPFRAFQLSPLANGNEDVMTGFDLFTKDRAKTTELFKNMTPEEQEKAANKSRENREYVGRKNRIVSEVENIQAKDANLPTAEREALNAIKVQISQMRVKDVNNDLNPVIVTLRNLGVRSQYRIEQAEWKKNKKAGTSLAVPNVGLPTTAEEFDQMGGLGGFLTQGSTSKTAGDYDRTPAVFGKLITRDANGVESIISAEDWVAARIADTKPLPGDSPEERLRKEKLAADWIATLAFSDKYNSFAQKRDAGYRVQLDSDGNPVRAYFLKPDEDALKNLTAEILTDMATHNIVGPVEDWIQAYAEQRQNLAQDATGIFGNGQASSSGSSRSGGGFYGGGGGGYGGGGGAPSTYYPSEAELLEPANGVARARLGRAMTADEEKEFVAFFRSLESSISSAGGMISRLDPQAQMISFLESRFNKEAAGQQAGKFVVALMNMLRSGNFNVG